MFEKYFSSDMRHDLWEIWAKVGRMVGYATWIWPKYHANMRTRIGRECVFKHPLARARRKIEFLISSPGKIHQHHRKVIDVCPCGTCLQKTSYGIQSMVRIVAGKGIL